MNEEDLHFVADQNGIPQDWENNTSFDYLQYYRILKLRLPPVASLAAEIAKVLQEIIEHEPSQPEVATPFAMTQPSPISLQLYLDRLARYSCCSPEAYILSVIYIDKYHRRVQHACLCDATVHK